MVDQDVAVGIFGEEELQVRVGEVCDVAEEERMERREDPRERSCVTCKGRVPRCLRG